jgi:D-3-phosphoglycerate dehydrogenase
LESALEGEVNIVNSELLLRERGLELVEESRGEMGDFSSAILAQVETTEKTYIAAGTVFGNRFPRLVRLGDFRLEAYLEGILLIFTHNDVPGIIGRVGTIFGQHRVNIAQMSVGRASNVPGGAAIGVLNLDNAPPQAALDEVLAEPDIHSLSVIHLPAAGEYPSWLIG